MSGPTLTEPQLDQIKIYPAWNGGIQVVVYLVTTPGMVRVYMTRTVGLNGVKP